MKTLALGGVLGFLVGALVVDYLTTRAGPQFIQVMRRSYQADEEQLAACARRRGDLREAARHYANAADASSLGGIQLWDKARRMWTAGLPVTSLMLDWIASAQGGMEGPERVRHFEESRNRAMLAYSLDHLGSSASAAEEYTKAARLLAWDDSRARKFATGWTASEDELLDKFGGPTGDRCLPSSDGHGH